MTNTETTAPAATTVYLIDEATAGGLDIQYGLEVAYGTRVEISGAAYVVVSVHRRTPTNIRAVVRPV